MTEKGFIHQGLHDIHADNDLLETWLRDHVVPTYDAMIADPDQGLSAQETWAQLEDHMAAARSES